MNLHYGEARNQVIVSGSEWLDRIEMGLHFARSVNSSGEKKERQVLIDDSQFIYIPKNNQ